MRTRNPPPPLRSVGREIVMTYRCYYLYACLSKNRGRALHCYYSKGTLTQMRTNRKLDE
jgi:hypothetical protein